MKVSEVKRVQGRALEEPKGPLAKVRRILACRANPQGGADKASVTLCAALVESQRGNALVPIKNSSTALAACRPSRMAHTTRLWPRRMSPAAKTLSTLVL